MLQPVCEGRRLISSGLPVNDFDVYFFFQSFDEFNLVLERHSVKVFVELLGRYHVLWPAFSFGNRAVVCTHIYSWLRDWQPQFVYVFG